MNERREAFRKSADVASINKTRPLDIGRENATR